MSKKRCMRVNISVSGQGKFISGWDSEGACMPDRESGERVKTGEGYG